jgi:hypothetical protein
MLVRCLISRVETFEWVHGPDLPPMRDRETGEREQVTTNVLEHTHDLGVESGEHAGDFR